MELIWSIADLAICRAGAITVAELIVCKIPAIFLPYPYHRDNHQEKNARAMVDIGTAVLVKDDGQAGERTVSALKVALTNLFSDSSKLIKMRQSFGDIRTSAAERIVEWIIDG